MSASKNRLQQFAALAALGAVALLAGCERLPMDSKQQGYRGTGMEQVTNPRIAAKKQAAVVAPPELGAPTPMDAPGPKAKDIYQNVKVLGDLPVAEFARVMTAITAWVSPAEGCTYCHTGNFAEETKYTKIVSRRMLQMTQHTNANWSQHVGDTGVTCWTCHRGQPVPAQVFYTAVAPKNNRVGSGMGDDAGQNKATPSIAFTSLPYDPYTPLLFDKEPIRVQGTHALPVDNRLSIKQAEFTYSLMNHMSEGLGVNCTYCHNTQSFGSWAGSPKARVTAWHGIQMVRDLNKDYLHPLTDTFPDNRKGPGGDVAKVLCGTCHQGVNKPLGGLAMAKDWPALLKPAAVLPALPAPTAGPRSSVLYFQVGSASLDATQAAGLVKLIETLKAQPRAQAVISGYHSASGVLAQNQELAKQRAFAVRDALGAAGIDAARVRLEKPVQASANLAGEDPAARRVEVAVR
jgi:photosynthetic reaction center cytochrome c subunit